MRVFLPSALPSPILALAIAAWALAWPGCLAADESSDRFLVRSWESEDGLPGNVLRSVAQAADGYLWVTTPEGVVRFDGVQFTGFDAEPDATLARLPMRTLFPLPNGDVWIATALGGLLRWHDGRLQAVLADADEAVPPPQNATVTQVFANPPDGVIAIRGAELWRVDDDGHPRQVPLTPELDQRRLADLSTWAERGRVMTPGDGPRLIDRRGQIWTVSATGGLMIGDAEGPTESVPLPTNGTRLRIAEMCEDREGNVWIATGESGLLQIRERRVNVLTANEGLSDRTASTVLQDRTGTWWVGNKSGGVDRLSGGNVTHLNVGVANRFVSALFEDRQGTLWAATSHGSVFRYDGGEFRVAFTSPDAPSKVAAMADDSRGGMWFGGLLGLVYLSDGEFTHIGPEQGFVTTEVSALAIDGEDVLWVGTARGEILRGRNGYFLPINRGDDPPMRAISGIHVDSDGSVWFTSLGGGLALWRGDKLTRFANTAGLPELRVTGLLDDHAGNLWMASLGGVFRVAKRELDAAVRDPRSTVNWVRFDRADGMLSRECTGLFQPAAWRGRDGELWFPTVNGVARIRPDEIALNPVPPPVVIESCRENSRRLPLDGNPLRAGPGRTRFEIAYTGLSLTAAEKVQFRLRLEGLENEWRDVGMQRVATYEAVPPGRYRFQVKASNADGVWNESGASLDIIVRPHFWETKTFRALAVLAVAGAAAAVGWIIARERMKRRLIALELRHAREAERARIARDLHDDLGASLTEISMLADVTAEETAMPSAREPLEEIAARAHALVGALDEIVWAVNPRHDTLASLADYLAATTADFVGAAGCALRLDVPRDLPACEVDAERRHTLLLAVRESLHNVVKHSGATEVWLRLRVLPGALEIDIEDNGRGFDPAMASSGDGLANLRERLAAIGGRCTIESTVGSGTRVAFRLPLASTKEAGARLFNGASPMSSRP